VQNKRRLLARIQIGEFASIIGMVKRSQRDIGRIFTVSGVHVCFRRRALHDAGYWSPETVTEDIDISWRLQLHYWDIRYEPRALLDRGAGALRGLLASACAGPAAASKRRSSMDCLLTAGRSGVCGRFSSSTSWAQSGVTPGCSR
jgi:hypothetical protein